MATRRSLYRNFGPMGDVPKDGYFTASESSTSSATRLASMNFFTEEAVINAIKNKDLKVNKLEALQVITDDLECLDSNIQVINVYDELNIMPGCVVSGTIVPSLPPNLQSIGDLTTVADQMLYTTAPNTFAVMPASAFSRGLMSQTTATTWQQTLLVEPGVNVQPYNSILFNVAQSGWTASNTLLYCSGLNTYSPSSLTSFSRTLLGAASASAWTTQLGINIGTNVQAFSQRLTNFANTGSVTADTFLYSTGTDTFAPTSLTATSRNLLAQTSIANWTAALGVTPGTNTQPFSALLTSIASNSMSVNRILVGSAVGAMTTALTDPFSIALLTNASASQWRTAISAQQSNANLTSLATLGIAANKFITGTGVGGTYALSDISQAGLDFVAAADTAAQYAALGLGTIVTQNTPAGGVVGLTASQTLTNKTITDSSNNVTARALFAGATTINVSGSSPPSAGFVLTATSANSATWQAAPASGPVSSTNNAIARWSGTSGNTLANSGVLIDASNNVTGVAALSAGSASVSGALSAATLSATNLTGTLLTAAQPNVTSLGTLTSLAVTGALSAGSISAGSASVSGALSAASVSATTLAGTLSTAAQPNVTSLGTLTSLAVTGTLSAGSLSAGSASISGALSAASVSATTLAGTLSTATQPNVTSLGTLSSLNVSGSLSVGSVSATSATISGALSAGSVTATSVAGTLTTASQPNVTSLGALTSLTVSGALSAGSVTTSGSLSAASLSTGGNLTVTGNIVMPTAGATVDGIDLTALNSTVSSQGSSITALQVTVAAYPSNLSSLTSAEVTQLTNINTSVISVAAWGFLASMDQSVASTATPTFVGLSAGAGRVTNVGTPTADSDAATKAYVDQAAQGFSPIAAADVASTANVAGTYSSGAKTLTRSGGSLTLTIDGSSPTVAQRVLLKNQSTESQNGVYVVTNNDGVSNWILTRAADFDQSAEVFNGVFVFVNGGTQNGNTGWVVSGLAVGFVLDTDPIPFSQVSGASTITAGDGLTKVGNTISAVGTASRVTVGASIDISAAYVGQTSITTLGVISSGTWSADTIAIARGGTGATNASSALSNLGGQPLSALLSGLAALTVSTSDLFVYSTGSNAFATATVTTVARTFLAQTSVANQRTALGLGSAATMAGPSSAIVGVDDIQTLTNKTLTSPTINGATIAGVTGVGGTVTFLGTTNLNGTVSIASPSITTPTITNPTISGGGSWASPSLTSASLTGTTSVSGTATFSGTTNLNGTVSIASPTITTPSITNPTITGGGSWATPSLTNASLSGSTTAGGTVTFSVGGTATFSGTTNLNGTVSIASPSISTPSITNPTITGGGSWATPTLTNATLNTSTTVNGTVSFAVGGTVTFSGTTNLNGTVSIASPSISNPTITAGGSWATATLSNPTVTGTVTATGATVANATMTGATITDTSNTVVATGLRTSGGAVTVSASASPTVGQVLSADSASVASWKTLPPSSSVTQYANCLVATTMDLGAVSFVAGVLTGTGTLTIGGVVLALTNRVLVKDQSNNLENGIYTLTQVNPWQLTRATDLDASAEFVNGGYTNVTSGLVNAFTTWTLSGIPTGFAVNVSSVVWYQTAQRTTISGTSNRITVGGTTNTTIDIASNYAGQTSITTLGVLSAGTWNASTIAVGFGGTGLSTIAGGSLLYAASTNVLSALSVTAQGLEFIGASFGNNTFLTVNASGAITAITGSAFGRAWIALADAASGRSALELGSAATMTGPTSAIVGVDDVQTLTSKDMTNNSNNLIARGLWYGNGSGSVSTYASSTPVSGQVLTSTGATTATWQTVSSSTLQTSSAGNPVAVNGSVPTSTDQTLVISNATSGSYAAQWAVPSAYRLTTSTAGRGVTVNGAYPSATKMALTTSTVPLSGDAVATWQTISAASLDTATGVVSISASAAPAADSIIIAASDSLASWRPFPFSVTLIEPEPAQPIIAVGTTNLTATFTASTLTVSPSPLVIDGVTITSNMTFMLVGQTNPAQNGVWKGTTPGAAQRSGSGFSNASDFVNGRYVLVRGSTTQVGTMWMLTGCSPTSFVVGTSAVTFVQITPAIRTTVTGLTMTYDNTARSYTLSGGPASGFVGLTESQTVTNKTLTSCTITDSTNNILARGLLYNSGSGSVSTFAASAPSANQLLVATSATTATWQSSITVTGVTATSLSTSTLTASSTISATTSVTTATVSATNVNTTNVTASGTVLSNTVNVGISGTTGVLNVRNASATAVITLTGSSGNVTATGTVSAANVSATGAVSGASVSATGTVSGASVSATGTVSGANVTASSNVTATGTVSGASVSATGAVSGASVSATGAIASNLSLSVLSAGVATFAATSGALAVGSSTSGTNVAGTLSIFDAAQKTYLSAATGTLNVGVTSGSGTAGIVNVRNASAVANIVLTGSTGNVACTSVGASGAVSGASVSSSGTLSATGAITGASLGVTTSVTGASMTATGTVTGAQFDVKNGATTTISAVGSTSTLNVGTTSNAGTVNVKNSSNVNTITLNGSTSTATADLLVANAGLKVNTASVNELTFYDNDSTNQAGSSMFFSIASTSVFVGLDIQRFATTALVAFVSNGDMTIGTAGPLVLSDAVASNLRPTLGTAEGIFTIKVDGRLYPCRFTVTTAGILTIYNGIGAASFPVGAVIAFTGAQGGYVINFP